VRVSTIDWAAGESSRSQGAAGPAFTVRAGLLLVYGGDRVGAALMIRASSSMHRSVGGSGNGKEARDEIAS